MGAGRKGGEAGENGGESDSEWSGRVGLIRRDGVRERERGKEGGREGEKEVDR